MSDKTTSKATATATNSDVKYIYQGNGKFNGYKAGDQVPADLFKDKPNKLKHMIKTRQIKKA